MAGARSNRLRPLFLATYKSANIRVSRRGGKRGRDFRISPCGIFRRVQELPVDVRSTGSTMPETYYDDFQDWWRSPRAPCHGFTRTVARGMNIRVSFRPVAQLMSLRATNQVRDLPGLSRVQRGRVPGSSKVRLPAINNVQLISSANWVSSRTASSPSREDVGYDDLRWQCKLRYFVILLCARTSTYISHPTKYRTLRVCQHSQDRYPSD